MYRRVVRQARSHRRHLLWIIPLLLVVTAGVAAFVTLFQWLRSEECRLLIERKTSGALHASTTLAPLQWGLLGVSSPSLMASGSEASSLKQLSSERIHARWTPTALMQGYWGIEEISLSKLSLQLGSPKSEAPLKVIEKIEEIQKVTPETNSTSSLLSKWLPSQLVIEVIHTDNADITIDIPNGAIMKIQDARLEAFPEKHPATKSTERAETTTETRVEVHGGTYSFSRFPDFTLKLVSLHARLSDHGTELTGAELTPPDGGSINLEGSFPSQGPMSHLSGRWQNIPLITLLPAIKDHLLGSLEGSGRMEWNPAGFHLAEGTLTAHDVTICKFPVLDKLSSLTGISTLKNLPVHEAHASFSRRGEATEWNDIVLESKGLVKCLGKATTGADGSLSGTFQLGVTPSIVAILPFAKEILGLDEHDGFIWMPVQIGGTLSHPTEDLSPRLGMAIAASATGMAREGIQTGLKILGFDKNITSTVATNAGATSGITPGTNSPTSSTNYSTNSLPNFIPAEATKTLQEGASKALDALGGFLR